jgi:predicted transcriptional regulator
MAFTLMTFTEAAVLSTVVTFGDKPISAEKVAEMADIPKRSVYGVLIGMTGVGMLEQVKMGIPKKGRPKMGYVATGLGSTVLDTNNQVLTQKARMSMQEAAVAI